MREMNPSMEFANKTALAYSTVCKPLCQELGLPQTAFDILLFLANNPGLDTARDICTYRGLKPGIVSFHVEKLVQEGYLLRQPAPEDRRKCRLVCTRRAEPVVQRGRQVQEAFFRRMTAGLDPQDLAAFRRCLEGFQRNLSQMTQEDDQ